MISRCDVKLFITFIMFIFVTFKHIRIFDRGCFGGDHMVDKPVQSVPITTKVVSSKPVHGEVYSIQHYVIKFVSDMRQVDGFLRVLWIPPPIKLTTTI